MRHTRGREQRLRGGGRTEPRRDPRAAARRGPTGQRPGRRAGAVAAGGVEAPPGAARRGTRRRAAATRNAASTDSCPSRWSRSTTGSRRSAQAWARRARRARGTPRRDGGPMTTDGHDGNRGARGRRLRRALRTRTSRTRARRCGARSTESEHLAHWMPCDIVGERRAGADDRAALLAGARRALRHRRRPTLPGTIEVWDPPAVFEWWWSTDRLRWELDEIDGGTRLRFTTWLGPDGKGAANTAAGYHVCLDQPRRAARHRHRAAARRRRPGAVGDALRRRGRRDVNGSGATGAAPRGAGARRGHDRAGARARASPSSRS